MKTVIIDPNWVDEQGRVITSKSTGYKLEVMIRVLEIETGEYWYGTLEKVDGFGRSFIRPLHQFSYGGWIDYE